MKKILSLVLVLAQMLAMGTSVLAQDKNTGVSQLSAYKIMRGDPDGNMRLNDTLTRGEAVTLLVRLYGFVPETSEAVPANEFPDMEEHWACNAAMIAKGLRITDKTGGEAFNPDESIASEEFVKMIIYLLGYNEVAEQRGGNPHGYLIQASQLGITKSIPMSTGQPITRSDAVTLICNSLDIPLMVMTTFSLGGENKYIILNGKNGVEYRTLRTMLETK